MLVCEMVACSVLCCCYGVLLCLCYRLCYVKLVVYLCVCVYVCVCVQCSCSASVASFLDQCVLCVIVCAVSVCVCGCRWWWRGGRRVASRYMLSYIYIIYYMYN